MKNKFDNNLMQDEDSVLDLSHLSLSSIKFTEDEIGKTILIKGRINDVYWDNIDDIILIDVDNINLKFYPDSEKSHLDLIKRCFEEAMFIIILNDVNCGIPIATCSAIIFDNDTKILVH